MMKNPPKAPAHHWKNASKPFQRIYMDYAEYKNEKIFVIFDAKTKWIEAYHAKRAPDSKKTMNSLKDFSVDLACVKT